MSSVADEGGQSRYGEHLARHQPLANRLGSFVGDQLAMIAFIPLLQRRFRLAFVLFTSGFAVMILGHVLAGNLRQELKALFREPLRSSLDEGRFLLGLWQAQLRIVEPPGSP